MSEKKSNHVKEKYDMKNVPMLAGEMRKKLAANRPKYKQFS